MVKKLKTGCNKINLDKISINNSKKNKKLRAYIFNNCSKNKQIKLEYAMRNSGILSKSEDITEGVDY